MRRNQHGAHSQGVVDVVNDIRSVEASGASSANSGAGAVSSTRDTHRRQRVSQLLTLREEPPLHDTQTEAPEEPAEAWSERIMREFAYALRLDETPGVPLAVKKLRALERAGRVLQLEKERLMRRLQPSSDIPISLPMRERNVLTLSFLGFKTPEIATRLGISPASVTTYLRDAANHLEVSGTQNAVKEAFARKLLLTESRDTFSTLPTARSLPANRLATKN